jgi:hypothetical protein
MTDDEHRWLHGTDPVELLNSLYPIATLGSVQPHKRQSRMYLLACARRHRVWSRLPSVCRSLVEVAEKITDGQHGQKIPEELAMIAARLMTAAPTEEDLNDITTDVNHYLVSSSHQRAPATPEASLRSEEWPGLAALIYLPFDTHTPHYAWVPAEFHDLHLLREVHGNPYRRTPFNARWRTDTALSLARTMYELREFSGMPILADALQDAGCDEQAILDHCRGPIDNHVRGCWVLDLVLNLR